ncbi:hypothetical protein HDU80_007789 [Chytriomyces hyalinus]|nr:hypothetical protein HDU80_007789 [Chytriomyces hyalinus]
MSSSSTKHECSAPQGSNSGVTPHGPACVPRLPPPHAQRGNGIEAALSAPHLANSGGESAASHSRTAPLLQPMVTQNYLRYDQPQPPQQRKQLRSQGPELFQYSQYSGVSSFACAPPSRPALNAMYPPYPSHGYGPLPPVQYAPPSAAHAPFPQYPDPYYAPYYSPYPAPLPAVPANLDAPPFPYVPVYAPIQYSSYFSHQSTNFQQTHLTNPSLQNTAPHSNPTNSSNPSLIYERKYSETSNTPSTTDFQTSLNQLPRKLQVAVNHVANTELPAAVNQVSHVAKNLAALVVIKRGKRAKFRAKRRFESESSLAEEDTADDYGNRKITQDNSPTLKHKCRMENCTRNFATLRLLQKHQTTKHPECCESIISTPVSQHELLLTPKGSQKKRKMSVHADATLTLNEVQTTAPINEPKTASGDTQLAAEAEQPLQDKEKTDDQKPVVAFPRNRDSDDEDLNDDDISHQSPISVDRRQTNEQIQALQAQQVGAAPAVQAQIQQQIGAALNAQVGVSSAAASAYQAQIQALQAQQVGATPAVQEQIQRQIVAILNAQAGVSSAATAYQAQIQALQAQQVGATPAIQEQIQRQIVAILNAQAGGSSAAVTAYQAQIQALQAQQVGATPAVQEQIQKQIAAILNAQAGVSSAATAYQAQIQALQAQQVGATPAVQEQIQKQIVAIVNAQAGVLRARAAQEAHIKARQDQPVGLSPDQQAQVQQQVDTTQSGGDPGSGPNSSDNPFGFMGTPPNFPNSDNPFGFMGTPPNFPNFNPGVGAINPLCAMVMQQMNDLANRAAGLDQATVLSLWHQLGAAQMMFC